MKKDATLIVCIDDEGGMIFNNRRVSRDRYLTNDVIRTVGDARLVIKSFSSKLFADHPSVTVSEDPLSDIGGNDLLFIEDEAVEPLLEHFGRLILYRWNRSYPYELKFDTPPEILGFKLVSREHFKGYSHDKITKEVYSR